MKTASTRWEAHQDVDSSHHTATKLTEHASTGCQMYQDGNRGGGERGRARKLRSSHEPPRRTVHLCLVVGTLICTVMSSLSANSSAPRPCPRLQRRPEASPRPEPPARLYRPLPLHPHPRFFRLVVFLQCLSRWPASRLPAKTLEKGAAEEARCLGMGARTWTRLKGAPRHRSQGAQGAGLGFRVRVGYGWNARCRS